MVLYETIFFVQFVIYFGVLFAQLYNIMGAGSVFDFRMSILLFVGALIFYGAGLVTVMIYPEVTLMVALFKLESWLWVLQALFLVIDMFLVMGKVGMQGAYKANEQER